MAGCTLGCCSVWVLLLFGILPRCVKIYAPEVWGRGQELHSDPNALWPALPGEHDAALQLFLSFRIHQYQHFIVVDLVPQDQQAAMGIYHQGFAHFTEFFPSVIASQRLQLHPVKHALTAPICCKGGFLHGVPIIGLPQGPVNCPFGQVCPIATLFCPATCVAQCAGRRMS